MFTLIFVARASPTSYLRLAMFRPKGVHACGSENVGRLALGRMRIRLRVAGMLSLLTRGHGRRRCGRLCTAIVDNLGQQVFATTRHFLHGFFGTLELSATSRERSLAVLVLLLLLLHESGALKRGRTNTGRVACCEHGSRWAGGRRGLKTVVSKDVRDWRKTVRCLCGRHMMNMAGLAETAGLVSMWAQSCERMMQRGRLNNAFVRKGSSRWGRD